MILPGYAGNDLDGSVEAPGDSGRVLLQLTGGHRCGGRPSEELDHSGVAARADILIRYAGSDVFAEEAQCGAKMISGLGIAGSSDLSMGDGRAASGVLIID